MVNRSADLRGNHYFICTMAGSHFLADGASTPVIPKGCKYIKIQSPSSHCVSQGHDDLGFWLYLEGIV